ncbi:hypothetical protein ACOSQ3_019282 [Xanthoceras sorbifolium]
MLCFPFLFPSKGPWASLLERLGFKALRLGHKDMKRKTMTRFGGEGETPRPKIALFPELSLYLLSRIKPPSLITEHRASHTNSSSLARLSGLKRN